MMRLLITGGSGFIATNFFQYLLTLPDEEQPEIRLFDRRYGQDLCRWEDVDKAWKEYRPEAVINFASYTHIDDSIQDPRRFWENNLTLMLNVLEACRKYDCRLLQISSSEVYGTAQYLGRYICEKCSVVKYRLTDRGKRIFGFEPTLEEGKYNCPSCAEEMEYIHGMDETHPMAGHSPYALTKIVQDRACYAWFETYELDVVIVRPFNQFGPYQQRQKVIPKFIYNIYHGLPLPVYAKGEARRDWLYVKDTVRGIWMALNKLPKGEVVNLATGKSWSVIELANLLKEIVPRVSGRPDLSKIVTVQHVDDRWGHVFHLEGSYEKARRFLGWEPKYTFPQALEETAKWYLQNEFAVPVRRE